jgi:hypothetical protein
MNGRTQILLVLTALCALAAKIVIAYNTFGTNDAITFEADIAKVKAVGPEELYRTGVEPVVGKRQPFSHSPPMIHGLLLLKKLEEESGLPVRFWIRVCCAFADLASLGLLWKIGIRSTAALFLNALAPVSLMVSGFHVNTDPLVACGLLASVYLIKTRRFGGAGIALGLALSAKLTALLFVPALAIAAGAKKTATILGVALACFYGLSLPFIWEFPKTIGLSMLGYSPLSKVWGITGILHVVGADGVSLWYASFGKFVALGAVVLSATAIRYRGLPNEVLTSRQRVRGHAHGVEETCRRTPFCRLLLKSCGVAAALFLVFAPGFGVQYLVYLVPWLAVASGRTTAIFYAISGTFLAAFYTWGSNGFPWYFANFFPERFMPWYVFLLEVLTWIATVFVAVKFAQSQFGKETGTADVSALRPAGIG